MKVKVYNLNDEYEIKDLNISISPKHQGKPVYTIDEDGVIFCNSKVVEDKGTINIIKDILSDDPKRNEATKYNTSYRPLICKDEDRLILYGIIAETYNNEKKNIFAEKVTFAELALFSKGSIVSRNPKAFLPIINISIVMFLAVSKPSSDITNSMLLFRRTFGRNFYFRGELNMFNTITDLRSFMRNCITENTSIIEWNLDNVFLNKVKFPFDKFKNEDVERFCYIQKENDDAIIRLFHIDDVFDPFEYLRIRISKNGNKVYRNLVLGWEEIEKFKLKVFIQDVICPLVGYDEDIFDTPFNYYADYLNGDSTYVVRKIVYATIYPAFDNLLKIDENHTFFKCLCNYLETAHLLRILFEDEMYSIFGTFKPEEKSFAKMIGVNNRILKRILNTPDDDKSNILFRKVIGRMKKLVGIDYLNSLDDESFNILYEFVLKGLTRADEHLLHILLNNFGNSNLKLYINKMSKYSKDPELYSLYEDYIFMLSTIIDDYPQFKWQGSDDINEMQRLHDDVMYLCNLKENDEIAEDLKKKFDKVKKDWKKYEFNNDNLSIITPKEPIDIIAEGAGLRHCVKTYLEFVCEKSTTILFIRKNSELDKPYFTLEIREGKIRQCHGFDNCDITPEISDFLKEFCKEKNVIYDDGKHLYAAD